MLFFLNWNSFWSQKMHFGYFIILCLFDFFVNSSIIMFFFLCNIMIRDKYFFTSACFFSNFIFSTFHLSNLSDILLTKFIRLLVSLYYSSTNLGFKITLFIYSLISQSLNFYNISFRTIIISFLLKFKSFSNYYI